jgi:penicillin-binding protein 1C
MTGENQARIRLKRLFSRRSVRIISALLLLFLLFLLVPVVELDDPLSGVILDRDGRLLSATIAADGQWRLGPGRAVPERYQIAATCFEDRRFFIHPGVDPLALVRAVWLNLSSGRVVSGGSTITMQVVRLARKGQPRTYIEKLIEMILALRLELAKSKQEILSLYAAYAPFGGNVVGLEAASWRYFGRDPESLSWAETAMLAVLPNSPALIHPGRNRELLLAKRNRLLDQLQAEGVIDRLTCSLSQQEQLPPRPMPLPMLAPHLLNRFNSERDQSDPDPAQRARLRTSLQRHLQERVSRAIDRHHRQLAGNGIHNAAALIVEVDSGQVLAYAGNINDLNDTEHGNHVDVIVAPRSTGSILKPFLYAAMLDAGEILPDQLVADIPTRIGGFSPENYDRRFTGAVPAATALARSLNVPAVRMLRSYGVDRFHNLLRRLGMTTLHRSADEYGLTLILGGAEVTLEEIVAMYAGLARTVNQFFSDEDLGKLYRPVSYELHSGPDRALPSHNAALGAGACYETLKAMLEVSRPGVDSAWRSFASARKIGWKTGTSYGRRDAWAVGVTPRHVVGVWVGNADGEGRPGLSGLTSAAPLMLELFGLLEASEWFDVPEAEMVDIEVCAASGMRAGTSCRRRRAIAVPLTSLPGTVCRYCQLVHCDQSGRWQVHGSCEPVSKIVSTRWFVLPPTMAWYYQRSHSDYQPLPLFRPDCRDAETAAGATSLSCIYPKHGSQIYVPVELDGSLGRTVFEATHRQPQTRVFWHIDDVYVGETQHIHQLSLAPAPGEHLLTLVDEHGEHLTRRFTILARQSQQATEQR